MALALFRNESDQRINCPIRTNTQRFCLARAVHYQPAPHHPGTRQEPSLYGLQPDPTEHFGINLGALAARGERGALIVSMDSLLRMSSNPFFPYLIRRIEETSMPNASRELSHKD
jgi:hypothetical protein